MVKLPYIKAFAWHHIRRQQFTLQPVTGPLQPLHFSFNEFADVKVPRKGFLSCVDLHADELLDRKMRDLGDSGVFHGF